MPISEIQHPSITGHRSRAMFTEVHYLLSNMLRLSMPLLIWAYISTRNLDSQSCASPNIISRTCCVVAIVTHVQLARARAIHVISIMYQLCQLCQFCLCAIATHVHGPWLLIDTHVQSAHAIQAISMQLRSDYIFYDNFRMKRNLLIP